MNSDSNCGVVPASCPSDQGPDQLRKNGKPDLVTECIEAAVASLPGRPGLNALTTGTHSEVVSTALAPATEAIEQQVTIDVNPESMTLMRLIRAFAEASSLRQSLFERMAGQPLTNKGKARAMLSAYLQLLDRELRLAQAIGLKPVARRTQSLAELVAAAEGK